MSLKKVLHGEIVYLLNKEKCTSCIFGYKFPRGDVFIPRSIRYENNDYLVTSILPGAFKQASDIKSIQFAKNSELQKIGKEAFSNSSVMMLSIPSCVREFEHGWCSWASLLKYVQVFKNGDENIKNYGNEFVLGKSNLENNFYDVLLFARRNVNKIKIPNFIKTISSHAFSYSVIEKILIPASITVIGEFAFSSCECLTNVEIEENSELQIIEKEAFCGSLIESISIPSSVVHLKDGWCAYTPILKKVEIIKNKEENIINFEDKFILGKTNLNSDVYDVLHFSRRDITTTTIPPFVRIISPYAFSESLIENIQISHHITHIREYAFSYCQQIQKVEVEDNSELQVIENYAFLDCSIESISIPSSVFELKDAWCDGTPTLTEFKVVKNGVDNIINYEDKFILGKSNLMNDFYDVLYFACRNIKTTTIPPSVRKISPYSFFESSIEKVVISPHLTHIGKCAFSGCQHLQKIGIPNDSELQEIGVRSFSFSSIEYFSIPSSVTKICENAFHFCKHLKIFEIPNNSELQTIEKEAFYESSIENFYVPPHITNINETAFIGCNDLQIIEISDKSVLQSIDLKIFINIKHVIIMVPSK